MHASIWSFTGDPDELLRAYDAMVAQIPRPPANIRLCHDVCSLLQSHGEVEASRCVEEWLAERTQRPMAAALFSCSSDRALGTGNDWVVRLGRTITPGIPWR